MKQLQLRLALSALIGLMTLTNCGCMPFGKSSATDSLGQPPPATREFRGVWVATVGNIDWPSEPGLSTLEQQKEAIQILDRCAAMKLNAVVLQVRTACDALYDSQYEPWSYFLTGKEGQAPNPYYDPLKFWVDESHRRGIELHAWFNPYRARPGGKYPHADTHISKTHPNLVKKYGSMEWLDPGEPEGLDHTLRVFMDVVQRYDIDGVHMDDYFYPYPEKLIPGDRRDHREAPFPDDDSFNRYKANGGKMKLEDWRRENVNQLIYRVYRGIKQQKPWVKFGLSPFGIWRPGYPAVVEGFSQYDKLYADAKLWLNNGWCDYWTPQLYWQLGSIHQPYLALLNWWESQNTQHRYIYPGMYTGRVGDGETGWPVEEVTGQIQVTRFSGSGEGNVHFSMKTFMQNRSYLSDTLRKGVYAGDVLVPASTWLDNTPPPPPIVTLTKAPRGFAKQYEAPTTLPSIGGPAFADGSPTTRPGGRFRRGRRGATRPSTNQASTQPADEPADLPTRTGVFLVKLTAQPGKPVWQWTVYTKADKKWTMHVYPANVTEIAVYDMKDAPIEAIAAASVDRSGNESKRVIVARPANLDVVPIAPHPSSAPSVSLND